MAELQFAAPETINQAIKILGEAKGKGKILAGGTDLLVQMRSGRLEPGFIIDVKKIPELKEIKKEKNGYRVGAAVSGARLGEHKSVKNKWPGVVEALELIGSTQIQGRASLGGNLCNGSPAADSVPAMIAAGVTCKIAGPKGRRTAKVEDIIIGPGKTSLKKGEFIVSFLLPEKPKYSSEAYLRLIPRTEMDIAVVGAGVSLTLDTKGICTEARVALGAVAPKPVLVKEAGSILVGTQLDTDTLEKVASACRAACSPIDDMRGTVEYRTKVAGVLATRAAKIAADRARSSK